MLPNKISELISKYGQVPIIDKEEKNQTLLQPSNTIGLGACVILKDQKNRFVLIRHNPNHRDINPRHWFFVCGQNEQNETLEETARRETFEEIGVRIEIKGVHHVGHHFISVGKEKHSLYYGVAFLAEIILGPPKVKSPEVNEVRSFSRLPSNFFPSHRKYYANL